MKEIKYGTVNAKFTWMLREHHGWTALHSAYVSTRAEWDKECASVVTEAANDSSDSPSLFNRAEFLDCEYYECQFVSLKPETTHIVTKSADEIDQFTNEADAQAALDEAMSEHGLDRLYCDRGGHAGPTERVDVSDIDITVNVGSGSLKFSANDLDTEFTAEDVTDKDEDLTAEEASAILEILHAQLAILND